MAKWYDLLKEGFPSPNIFKKDKSRLEREKCPSCGKSINFDEIALNYFVCNCGHHFRIGSKEYFEILFDNNEYQVCFSEIGTLDILNFVDKISYEERLVKEQNKLGLDEAIQVAIGLSSGILTVLAVMDFSFIGGTMGSVMGERIARAIDLCIEKKTPLVIISRSGGARMMESVYSLMQMAKTSAKLIQLGEAKLPFISVLTDPTTGGVTASVGMKGDFILAEPDALIGYTGPHVIRESMGKEPPKGFQKAEYIQKRGFLDIIVPRNELKPKIFNLLSLVIS